MPLKQERPGYWRGDLWHRGDRVKLTFRGSAKQAKAYEAQRRLEVEQRGIVHTSDVPTFEHFIATKYEPMAKLDLRDWNVRRYKLKPLRAYFGRLKLTQIDEQHIEGYKQWRAKAVAKVTVNGELDVYSAVRRYAADLRVPCTSARIRRFRVKSRRGKVKAFSRAEVALLLAAASQIAPWFHTVVKFLVETGARKSEAINLPWKCVDFERRLVRIWNQVDDGDGEDDPEKRQSYEVKSVEREVTLSDGLVLALRDQQARCGASEWVFPVVTNRMRTKGGRYASFPKHMWKRLLARANRLAKRTDPSAGAIRGGPHRCRHTFASHFLAAKPDLFALGRILGHSHGRVTELYSHLLPEHLGATRNVVTFEAAKFDDAEEGLRAR